jgi:hypothetical protein
MTPEMRRPNNILPGSRHKNTAFTPLSDSAALGFCGRQPDRTTEAALFGFEERMF